MKQFDEAFDGLRKTLEDIKSLSTEAVDDFNEAQEGRAKVLLDDVLEAASEASAKADAVLQGIDDAREQRQAESDAREPIELPKSDFDPELQAKLDKIGKDAADSIQHGIDRHESKVDTLRGAGPVQTVQTGNVADRFVHGDAIELATSEGALEVHSTDDGSRVISEEGEGLKILTPDQPKDDVSDAEKIVAEVFPEGSSRNEGWDSGFAGDGDPYGVREYTDQSASPNAFTDSLDADKPADPAAHIAGQEEVIREAHPEGDTTPK